MLILTVHLNLRYTSTVNQPGNASQVQQPIEEPPERIIMRSPVQTRTMVYGHRLHFTTCTHNQCRQETMHVIEPRQLQKHATVEHLDAATGVRSSIRQNSPPHCVGDSRREQSPPRVLTTRAMTGNHLHPLPKARLQQQFNHGR
jgi:hypothetical protein